MKAKTVSERFANLPLHKKVEFIVRFSKEAVDASEMSRATRSHARKYDKTVLFNPIRIHEARKNLSDAVKADWFQISSNWADEYVEKFFN